MSICRIKSLRGVKTLYKARDGGHGQKQKKAGARGADILIKVHMQPTLLPSAGYVIFAAADCGKWLRSPIAPDFSVILMQGLSKQSMACDSGRKSFCVNW